MGGNWTLLRHSDRPTSAHFKRSAALVTQMGILQGTRKETKSKSQDGVQGHKEDMAEGRRNRKQSL